MGVNSSIALAGEDEMVCHLCSAQIVDVDCAIVIHDFGEPQPYVGPRGALQLHPFDAGQVLAEIVRRRLRAWVVSSTWRLPSFDANRRIVLRHDLNGLGSMARTPVSIVCIEAAVRSIPAAPGGHPGVSPS